MVLTAKKPTIEIDFINEIAIHHDKMFLLPAPSTNSNVVRYEVPKYIFKKGMKEKFLTDVVGSYFGMILVRMN